MLYSQVRLLSNRETQILDSNLTISRAPYDYFGSEPIHSKNVACLSEVTRVGQTIKTLRGLVLYRDNASVGTDGEFITRIR